MIRRFTYLIIITFQWARWWLIHFNSCRCRLAVLGAVQAECEGLRRERNDGQNAASLRLMEAGLCGGSSVCPSLCPWPCPHKGPPEQVLTRSQCLRAIWAKPCATSPGPALCREPSPAIFNSTQRNQKTLAFFGRLCVWLGPNKRSTNWFGAICLLCAASSWG